MSRDNRTHYAVLGMLTTGPKSGYDLKREFDARLAHFWAESAGQIYPALRRLSADGLVQGKTQRQSKRPDRTVYRITAAGRRALREWLAEPAGREQVRNELLLKIFFGPQVGPDAVWRLLERFEQLQSQLYDRLGQYEKEIDRQAESAEQRLYWRICLSSGRHVSQARLAWCREAKRSIRNYLRQGPGGASEMET